MEHLPPGPFSYETVSATDDAHPGAGHVYLVDRDGRKIAALWGKPEEKLALADLIIKAREQASEAVKTLRQIAALDDSGANEHLASTGSYGRFDEPAAVQAARECLKLFGIVSV